ncbi:ABC transporter ATP-binding protein [Actinotalea ferrariae CF5-4]|uniref:ABC transporter ATP-binding protein n=1 Tax=Actinotalea ferrariae CF5-4 TaxID=948458 RepID=A0A021VLH4_9CELL|nr:metal ABC transporter ATP-binding protein [Actinotalea ferrariae]EYR62084.1 ABC transporter ATP-binding protein [Actinotalea ferrariae CF5-4]
MTPALGAWRRPDPSPADGPPTGTPAGTPALRVRGLGVRYREVVALEDVDLEVGVGEACGLVGMNGSGKSTLFRTVVGLQRAGTGDVTVLGRSVDRARAEGLLGYVPQQDDLDRDFPVTVRDVVLMGRYHRMGLTRRARAADEQAADDALARVGLADLADRRIGRLSGGQRQRALLARALAQDARVLLLDEPFTGLDVTSQAAVEQVLRELVAAGGSVLVSTHDLGSLPQLCSRSVLLHRRVLAAGPTAEVLTPENLARAFGLDASGWTATGPGGAA